MPLMKAACNALPLSNHCKSNFEARKRRSDPVTVPFRVQRGILGGSEPKATGRESSHVVILNGPGSPRSLDENYFLAALLPLLVFISQIEVMEAS